MKVKTADLTRNALCYAVCMLEMPHLKWGKTIGIHYASNQIVVPELPEPGCYSPFLNWAQGGPIIEREGIQLRYVTFAGKKFWDASKNIDAVPSDIAFGDAVWFGTAPLPLIAAMRCYVASKLGDEVDIPEELI